MERMSVSKVMMWVGIGALAAVPLLLMIRKQRMEDLVREYDELDIFSEELAA